jgi:hypothetical protein
MVMTLAVGGHGLVYPTEAYAVNHLATCRGRGVRANQQLAIVARTISVRIVAGQSAWVGESLRVSEQRHGRLTTPKDQCGASRTGFTFEIDNQKCDVVLLPLFGGLP